MTDVEHSANVQIVQEPKQPTVLSQYRAGRTLGSGTYAIVKEAIHLKTGEYFACKIISKRLIDGDERMARIRSGITVLKRISSGHKNIVTLRDYFETSDNLYLCFDLCSGGELFDRICNKGSYYEADAVALVRTIFETLSYIHASGIVHGDLKPENLLFRTKAEDADIMIADFGCGRVMEQEKHDLLTEVCGTPGYMAPEILKKAGHGMPVDVWAMGVTTYFLLAGYPPFERRSQTEETQAIIAGDYKFEPKEYWANVSDTARDFVRECLSMDPGNRPTAEQALRHKWLADPTSPREAPPDLLPFVKKSLNAKQLWRKAALSITALHRLSARMGGHLDAEARDLSNNVRMYKQESDKEVMESAAIMHHHSESLS